MMMLKTKTIVRSFIPFFATTIILTFVEYKVEMPMLLLERFLPGWGWIEIIILGLYASFLFSKLLDPSLSAKWRKISWTIFAVFFFAQLSAGLLGCENCLMTGKLHFPIPAMIIGGAIYRLEIGFMPILFLSTIILSGPAWCSQLCYFGAFDNLAAYSKKIGRKKIFYKDKVKTTFLVLMITGVVLLRVFQLPVVYAVIGASVIGITGVVIIIFISPKTGKMIHCIAYCPIGTIIQYLKYVNPFRVKIQQECTECMVCTTACPYDALNKENILSRKPGHTCTYCGDCLYSCHGNFIAYTFFKLSPNASRKLWLIITVVIHSAFMGLARI
jgi:polyferredoxin